MINLNFPRLITKAAKNINKQVKLFFPAQSDNNLTADESGPSKDGLAGEINQRIKSVQTLCFVGEYSKITSTDHINSVIPIYLTKKMLLFNYLIHL